MTPAELAAQLTKAEGYLELGMTDEAWGLLDDLPSEKQIHFPVLVQRFSILIATKSWFKAELIGETLVKGMPENGHSWYALAHAQLMQGKIAVAKASLQMACKLDPKIRLKALKDPKFKEVWD